MATAEFSDEILKAHNVYRTKHHAPNLKISEKLNKIAQEWAENLATKDKAEHRPDNPHGENIYMASSTDPNWKLKGDTVVKSWYDEIKLYKFGESSPKNSSEVGHFTQLVWKESLELGIGEAKSKTGRVYVVCNYDPPGNVVPQFGKNVLPINLSSKNENGQQPIDDGSEEDREKIVLTPSQEEIGIQFVQPNLQIVKSMERLYAVSSEKVRVWSVWLTKVGEKANEWNAWLRSHINLVLRMSEHLRRAERDIEKNKLTKSTRSSFDSEQQYREDSTREVKKASSTADGERPGFEESSRGTSESYDQESDRSEGDAERRDTMPGTNASRKTIELENERKSEEAKVEEEEVEEEEVAEKEVEEEDVGVKTSETDATGMEQSSTSPMNDKDKDENEEFTNVDENGEENESEVSLHEEEMKEEGTVESKKIAWPIGVPWEPLVPTAMEESKVPEQKKNEEVKVIAIPENEEDMQSLVREMKKQATIYRSLYKHWLEVGGQAVKEIVNRTVMESDVVPTNEEIPYFFYVNTEPDIEIGVEHDDEEILLPDLTRERLICDFTPLHFNLADKPGMD